MGGSGFSTDCGKERLFTCGVLLPDQPPESDGPLSELKALVEAADAEVDRLSGGVDSSVVVGSAARQSPNALRTFSIGFNEEKFSELPTTM